MANLNLSTTDIRNVFFGTRKAKFVFLGNNLLHIKDATAYIAGNLNVAVDTTIEGGTASIVPTNILQAPGA